MREARTEAAGDIDARKKAIEDLLAPMAKTLEQVDREIKDSERRRVESGAQLMQRIASLDTAGQGLRDETRRLTDALKRPGVRGRWGELQLKRVVELAGMIEYCDFMEQHTIQGGDDERAFVPTSSSGCRAASGSSSTRRRRSTPTSARSRRPTRSRGRTCSASTRAGAQPHLAAVREELLREGRVHARVRRHVPARRDVLQRRARAGSVADRVRRREARHPGEPDDADRAAAGGGLRLAAGGDGRERAQDQRERQEPLRGGPHARRSLPDARHASSSRASKPTTTPSARSKATSS